MKDYQEVYDFEVSKFKEEQNKRYSFDNDVIKPIIKNVFNGECNLTDFDLSVNYSSNGHQLTINIIEKDSLNFYIILNKQSGEVEKSFSVQNIELYNIEKLELLERKIKIYQTLSENITIQDMKDIFKLYRKSQKEYKVALERYNDSSKKYNEEKNKNKMDKLKLIFQKEDIQISKNKFENFKLNDPNVSVVDINVDSKNNLNFQREIISIQESSNGRKNYYANSCLISKKEAEKKFLNNYLFNNKPIKCLNDLPFNKEDNTQGRYSRQYSSKFVSITFENLLKSLQPEIVAKIVNLF